MSVIFSELKAGDTVEIEGFCEGNENYKMKLLSLGLTRGTHMRILRIAPLGDPLEIDVRGFRLSLRKSEAEILKLKEIK